MRCFRVGCDGRLPVGPRSDLRQEDAGGAAGLRCWRVGSGRCPHAWITELASACGNSALFDRGVGMRGNRQLHSPAVLYESFTGH